MEVHFSWCSSHSRSFVASFQLHVLTIDIWRESVLRNSVPLLQGYVERCSVLVMKNPPTLFHQDHSPAGQTDSDREAPGRCQPTEDTAQVAGHRRRVDEQMTMCYLVEE